MNVAIGLCSGIGLSAASGFRVFVPMFLVSLGNACGLLTLSAGSEWVGSWPAVIVFAVGSTCEIAAFYVPWFDNLCDSAAMIAAPIAGAVLTSSQVSGIDPVFQWTLAAIAGGGTALTVQAGTTATRAVSTGTTGGFGNFIVSTLELVAAVVVTILAVVVPVLCALLVVFLGYKSIGRIARYLRRRQVVPASVA